MALFGSSSPKLPDPPAPTAPPATTDTQTSVDQANDRLRRRRGTAATVLAGDTATVGQSSVATKTLLGA
jgi:hypothetical protein